MPRLIDGDRLIDWLRIVPLENGMIDPDTVVECIREMSTVATDTNVLGKWIGADKRPPKQGRYLVWGLTQFVPDHTNEPNEYWQTKIAQWFDGTGWDCKVKFWQMLPEPPKEATEQ